MHRKKYVILDECFPIIFTEAIGHDNFKSISTGVGILKPTSAGFFDTTIDHIRKAVGDYITVNTYGESVSLKLQSKPEDARLIEKLLNGNDNGHRSFANLL